MAKTINVGILGLERIGVSVGLALKRCNAGKDAAQQFVITGYDTQANAGERAKELKAVDQVVRDPAAAAAQQDIVVLALPFGEVQGAYRAMAPSLRMGAVVLDCSTLKAPANEWATKHLPEHAHAVGVMPILNAKYLFDGRDAADFAAADLFDKGAWLVAPGANSASDAVELASDFGLLLGAVPLFVDPVELDSWSVAVELMPALIGFGAFYTLLRSDHWQDAQRAGNPAFGRLTHHLYDLHPDDLRDLLLTPGQRLSLVQHMDRLIDTLTQLRGAVAKGDKAALEAALVESSEQYNVWVNRRVKGDWDEGKGRVDQPSRSDMLMSGLFGTALAKRFKRDGKS
jgi:prephenate dehydrogenase